MVVCVVGGLIYGTAYPLSLTSWVGAAAVVAPILVVALCGRIPAREALQYFCIFILVGHVAILRDLPIAITDTIGLGLPFAWGYLILLAVSIWQTIPFAAAYGLYTWSTLRERWFGPLLGGGLFVLAIQVLPTPFPGSFQHPLLFVPRLNASVLMLGPQGFAWLVTTTILAGAALGFREKRWYRCALVGFCMAVFALGLGWRASTALPTQQTLLNTLVVQDGLLFGEALAATEIELQRRPGVHLVVFGESMLVDDDHDAPAERKRKLASLRALTERYHVNVLFVWARTLPGRRLSTSTLFSPGGQTAYRDKQLLMPLGEYMPRWFQALGVPGINQWRREWAHFEPGTANDAFIVDGVPIQVLLCYESLFPSFVERVVPQRARLIVVQSNLDAFANAASIRSLHMALEAALPMSRDVSIMHVLRSGPSTVISAEGALDEAMLADSSRTPFYRKTVRLGVPAFPAWRSVLDQWIRLAAWCTGLMATILAIAYCSSRWRHTVCR
ncbi:hypothetical protein WJ62_05665 [Burkholderia diffusa]|nr:hypothetical protein WJ62_05665 [Burkholderia diffusa]